MVSNRPGEVDARPISGEAFEAFWFQLPERPTGFMDAIFKPKKQQCPGQLAGHCFNIEMGSVIVFQVLICCQGLLPCLCPALRSALHVGHSVPRRSKPESAPRYPW